MKKVFAITLVVALAGTALFFIFNQNKSRVTINSFEECAKLYPVMESYPARCSTPDGKSFTQNIGNELDYTDQIIISTPRPNQKINSPLSIAGKARGKWFFEGSLPAELKDGTGKSIGTGVMRAEGEWMTEEFVSFSGEIDYQKPTTATGTLIIRNDNPSGLQENAKEIKIPVAF